MRRADAGVLLLADVCQEFLPPGVLNVVTGLGEECGASLANHPAVRKPSFTGSTEVGKLVMRAASDRIPRRLLELGGKSPSIVFPDANEDWVIDGIIAAMRFTCQSQSCTAGSRLFLHRDIFDKFRHAPRLRRVKNCMPNDTSRSERHQGSTALTMRPLSRLPARSSRRATRA